jgi:hypothetical protein
MPMESTNRFSGPSGGDQKSDGETDCLRAVGPDFEAELIDHRNRLGAFDGPLTLPAKLSMV